MKSVLLLVASIAFFGGVAEGGIFSSSESSCRGKTVPRGKCALLFDDENCGGWEYEVPIGYSELPRFALSGPTKNDAEPVWVKPGCNSLATITPTETTSAS